MHSFFSLILLLSPVLLCLLLHLPRSPLLLHTIQLYLLNLQHLQCRCILPCVVWNTVACILTSGWNPKGIQLWLSGIPPITSHSTHSLPNVLLSHDFINLVFTSLSLLLILYVHGGKKNI
jgi:hypothetical protein